MWIVVDRSKFLFIRFRILFYLTAKKGSLTAETLMKVSTLMCRFYNFTMCFLADLTFCTERKTISENMTFSKAISTIRLFVLSFDTTGREISQFNRSRKSFKQAKYV